MSKALRAELLSVIQKKCPLTRYPYAQHDLPITHEPFKEIVQRLDIDYDTLFGMLQELQEAGVMRRFAAILNHRKAGFNANAMVVWDVDEAHGEEIGRKAAEFSAVSHYIMTTGRMAAVKSAFDAGRKIECESRLNRKAAQSVIVSKDLGWRMEGDLFTHPGYTRTFHAARCIVKTKPKLDIR